jgi:YlmC/YmxH family sporulation protein
MFTPWCKMITPWCKKLHLGANILHSMPFKSMREGNRLVRISEFQVKDVVNISDGKKLGNIGDIEINLDTGRIEAIVIGTGGKLLGFFGKEEDVVIPWKSIVKIGEDVILVRHKESHYVQGQLEEPKESP